MSIHENLMKPFPEDMIRQRVGSGNKKFDYIKHGDVVNKLVTDTGNSFDWEVKRLEQFGEGKNAYWLCEGTLTVPELGSRDGVGTQQAFDLESPKAAETDALKRAAVKFGVALQLYCDLDEYEGISEPKMAGERELKAIDAAAAAKGVTAVLPNDLTYEQAVQVMTILKALPDMTKATA